MTDHPRVVVLGAGFGGHWAARSLAHTRADVLLVDRNIYHTFLPLLYQVAAAELSPEDIVYPVRSILRKLPNVQFQLSDVHRPVRGLGVCRMDCVADRPPGETDRVP